MKNNSQLKAIIIIVVVIVALLAIITIPSFVSNTVEEEREYFPTYEKIDVKRISESDNSSEKYVSLKTKLEKDPTFAREMLLGNYNYNSFDGSNLRMLIRTYIFSYQLTNTKYLSVINEDDGKFCMKQKYVIESFKELYNINITEKLEYFPGYFEYITKTSGRYCFNYRTVTNEYDDQIAIGIDEMSTRSGIVKAKVYVYEYHSNDTSRQKAAINNLKNYINKSDFTAAKKVVIDQLNGSVTYKQVQFKVNNNAKFYKYQILSMKILDK